MTLTHETGCPEDVLAAIAWYPDGLDAERRGAVEAHAADCSVCREEISFLRGESPPQTPAAEADRVYARVLERIEAYESRARGVERRAPPARRASRFVPARAAAAVVAAAGVGALSMWIGSRVLSQEPVYHTAGAPTEVASVQPGLALDVVFRPDATAERIQSALRAIGGEVVSGPTQLGVYHVRLSPSADASAAAQVLQGEGRGVASFAQPAPPPAG
ncbi:MAG TPA: hypothetical protein VMS55_17025 [Myxococcota bacterium]|nr:hypothetical protein [Myxococcota bacterium]